MHYTLIHTLADEDDLALSQRVLGSLTDKNKAVLIFDNAARDGFAILANMGFDVSGMSRRECEIYNFSRNISSAVNISKYLHEHGKNTRIADSIIPFEESVDVAHIMPYVEKELISDIDVLIVCIIPAVHNYTDEEFVLIEMEQIFSGLIVVDSILECKINLGDNVQLKCLDILKKCAEAGISLDMINICHNELYFIFKDIFERKFKSIIAEACYSISRDLVKLSFLGLGMKGVPGVMARIYSLLESNGITIIRSTDSHTTISCIIERQFLQTALELAKTELSILEDKIKIE